VDKVISLNGLSPNYAKEVKKWLGFNHRNIMSALRIREVRSNKFMVVMYRSDHNLESFVLAHQGFMSRFDVGLYYFFIASGLSLKPQPSQCIGTNSHSPINPGLNYLSLNGFPYRNLKPRNILMNDWLGVRFTDLGMSRVTYAQRNPDSTANVND